MSNEFTKYIGDRNMRAIKQLAASGAPRAAALMLNIFAADYRAQRQFLAEQQFEAEFAARKQFLAEQAFAAAAKDPLQFVAGRSFDGNFDAKDSYKP